MYQEHVEGKGISLHSASFVHELMGPSWVANMFMSNKAPRFVRRRGKNNGQKGRGKVGLKREGQSHKDGSVEVKYDKMKQ